MNKIATRLRSAALVLSGWAISADYPTCPIRIVDPFAPPRQHRSLIDARPGAGSSQVAAQVAPHGYTVLFNNVGLVTASSLAKKPPFDLLRDFTPVIMVGTQLQFIIAPSSTPCTCFKDQRALGDYDHGGRDPDWFVLRVHQARQAACARSTRSNGRRCCRGCRALPRVMTA